MDIQGKVFVVTGGGAGIGRATVLELLSRGGKVAAVDLNEAGLAETMVMASAGSRLSVHPLNIVDREEVLLLPEKVVEEHGQVDGLINVAGIIQQFIHVKDLEFKELERVMNVNFWGTVNTTKAFLPYLLNRHESSLVNISSMGALLPVPGQTAYGASKAAVRLLTEGLFAELQGSPVKVTEVFPGAIGTEITKNSGVERASTGGESAKSKTTSPAEAGRQIVDAVERSTFRVHIGSDAKLFDRLSRLTPQRAILLIAKRMKSEVLIPDVHPELIDPLKRMPKMNPQNRLMRLAGRHAQNLMRTPKIEGVTIQNIRVGDLRLRLYEPAQTQERPGLLWIHGGGLVIGAMKQDDRLCAQTAAQLGITIVSVGYRLAPENPFPAALDDVTAGWRWLVENAEEWNIDTARLVIGGESAGGGIAASLVQRLHDDQGATQPVAQWLFAPMLDDRTAARTDLDAIEHPVWNNVSNRYGWASYLGQEPGSNEVTPYAAAARRGDLGGLPPTWIYSGDAELFHDEIQDYAARLTAAGVDTQLEIIAGGAHGFENWAHSTALAQSLLRNAHQWLAERLAVTQR